MITDAARDAALQRVAARQSVAGAQRWSRLAAASSTSQVEVAFVRPHQLGGEPVRVVRPFEDVSQDRGLVWTR